MSYSAADSEHDATAPDRLRHLRACLHCKLIKTYEQFREEGCDNCGGAMDEVHSFTTPLFKGTIAMMNPRQSWVARWQKQEKLRPGLYAIQVTGSEPQVERRLDDEDE